VHEIEKLHVRYGPIVRTAPDEISVADPDGWKDIYAARPGHKSFPKNPIWWGGKSTGQPESLINAEDPADHERMRRLLSPAFSPKAVEAQESTVQSYVDLLIEKLRERAAAKENVDIVSWYNFTTFDIVGDLGFGEPFNCLKESKYHPWVATIFSHFKYTVMLAGLRFYPPIVTILTALIPPSVRRLAMKNQKMAKDKIHRRLNLEKDRNDFMTPVIREQDAKSMTIFEIEGTFNTVIIAGSETTATVLSGITNYLTRDSVIMNKLCAEIRSTFHYEKEITFSNLKDLPYLNAVIQEGMRTCPPAPAGLPRVVPPDGDTVCGHWFPGGVRLPIIAIRFITY
jgi:cytochrome P450